jgi:hypothetical protein
MGDACSPPSLPVVEFVARMQFDCISSSLRDCGVWVGCVVLVSHCCCVTWSKVRVSTTSLIFVSNVICHSISGVDTHRVLGWGCCCVGELLGCCVQRRYVRLLSTPTLFEVSCVCGVCAICVHRPSYPWYVSRSCVWCVVCVFCMRLSSPEVDSVVLVSLFVIGDVI